MNIESQYQAEKKSTWSMVKEIFIIAIPSAIGMVSNMFVEVINLAFVGHLGDPVLVAGVGLGNMYINTMGFAILIGLNTVISTLSSQSYGQGNMKLCGIYLNRGRIIDLLACIPVTIIMLMAEKFFLLLQIDASTSAVAQLYISIIIPVMIAISQFDLTRQFLNTFEKSHIPMWIQLTTTPLHLLWCWILVSQMNLGVIGCAIATNITFYLNLVVITIYITYFEKDLQDAWFLPNKDCLIGLLDYLKLGIPAMFMVCLEWWTFEIQTFIASFISIDATGTQVIILNTIYVVFSFTLGLQYSSQSLIGRAVGAQNIKEAKRFRRIHMNLGFGLAIILFTFLFFCRTYIAEFYTNIESLQGMVSDTFKVVAIVEIFDCTQGWSQGIIRGLGKFNHAMFGQFIAFYLISIPLGYVIGFTYGYGLSGVWYGFMVGLSLLAIYYFYLIIIHFNWEEIAKQTKDRERLENERCEILHDEKTKELQQKLIEF